MFNVLFPVYVPAGKDFEGKMQYNIQWNKVGTASNMQNAKKKYGGNPVLSEV